jgi:N-acetylmuramoyl-L-alanine amidase
MHKKYIIKIVAGLSAVVLTFVGAWYTAGTVRENHYVSVSTSQQDKQVIVLDAGHGGCS